MGELQLDLGQRDGGEGGKVWEAEKVVGNEEWGCQGEGGAFIDVGAGLAGISQQLRGEEEKKWEVG